MINLKRELCEPYNLTVILLNHFFAGAVATINGNRRAILITF